MPQQHGRAAVSEPTRTPRPLNVLFLCTGNSARSIMAECYLNHAGGGRLRGFSAGSFPKGEVNPLALSTLGAHGIPVGDVSSKSWDKFSRDGAPIMDVVITVCDSAAGEVCPIWPGAPTKAHWSFPDPHDAQDFEAVFASIRKAVDLLVDLPIEGVPGTSLGLSVSALGPRA